MHVIADAHWSMGRWQICKSKSEFTEHTHTQTQQQQRDVVFVTNPIALTVSWVWVTFAVEEWVRELREPLNYFYFIFHT